MKSLFNPEYNREIIDRLQKLNSKSAPVWGKMTAAQMVTHAQAPFKVALEELQLKRGLLGILFGGIAKKKLLSPEPFGKNLPTDKNFIVKRHPDFEIEKNKLVGYIQRFSKSGPGGITTKAHPFFGKLTPEEWDTLVSKHMDHHLRQFGA